MKNKYNLFLGISFALAINISAIHATYSVDTELRSLINQQGLSGAPSKSQNIPSIKP